MKLLQNKTNVAAPDAVYPYGNLKNDSGANNGTPVDVEMLTDYVQLHEKIFADSGIVANGLPDNATNGFQLFDAFVKTLRKRPYKAYTVLITQTGTNDPTVVVLENQLSASIVWIRTTTGKYLGTLVGAFTNNKTYLLAVNEIDFNKGVLMQYLGVDNIQITTQNAGVASDGVLTNNSIEIRVYD